MADPASSVLENPDPDSPQLIGGEYGAPALQSVPDVTGQAQVGPVPRATMIAPAPLGADFGVFHDLVPSAPGDRPPVGGIDYGSFSDLIPRTSTPETDSAVQTAPPLMDFSPKNIAAAQGRLGLVPKSAGQVETEIAGAQDVPLIPKQALPPYWYGKGLEALANRAEPGSTTQKVLQASAGAMAGEAELGSGLTTPANFSLLALAPESRLGQGLVAGAFLGQAMAGTPENWKVLKNAYDAGDWGTVSKTVVEMGGQYALPALGLAHALKPRGKLAVSGGGEPTAGVVSPSGQRVTPETGVPESPSTPAAPVQTAPEVSLGQPRIEGTAGFARVQEETAPAVELYSGQRQGGPRTNWMTSDINVAKKYAGEGGQVHVYNADQFPVPIEDMREDVPGEPTNAPVGTYSFHGLSEIEPTRSMPSGPEPAPSVQIATEEQAHQAASDIGGLKFDGVQRYPTDTGISNELNFTITEPGKETTLSVPEGITAEELRARKEAKLQEYERAGAAVPAAESPTQSTILEKTTQPEGVADVTKTEGGEGNATKEGIKPEDNQPEHRGVSQRADIPEDLEQTRESDSGQAGDSGGNAVGGEEAPKPVGNDWTASTETPEEHGARLKFKADKEGGFVDLSGVADFGKRIYEKGMDFARWSAEMVRHLGEKVRGHLKTIWDSFTGKNLLQGKGEAGGVGLTGFGKRMKPGGEGALGFRRFSELDKITGEHDAKLQHSYATAERIAKEANRIANARAQRGMSIWRQAKGDPVVLKDWATKAKGKMFRQAAEDALKLKPDQVAFAQKAANAFDTLGARGQHYDVLGQLKDAYIPQIWETGKQFTGFGGSKLRSQFKFAKASTFKNYFEGDQAGWIPKKGAMEIGNNLPMYMTEMNKVIADRQFAQEAAKASSKEGEPLIVARGRAEPVPTKGKKGAAVLVTPQSHGKAVDLKGNPVDQSKYVEEHGQPALKKWRWVGKDTQGKPIFMQSDVAIHPELHTRMNAMMGRSAIRKFYDKPATGFAAIPQALLKNLDVSQAVMKREMFGLFAPFHQVQEGTHAIGHTVNPFFGLEKMEKLTPDMMDAARHGLVLKPSRVTGTRYLEGVGARRQFISSVTRRFGGEAGRRVANAMEGFQTHLFDQYIPSLKWKTYQHALARNMKRYSKDIAAGTVATADVKALTATQANAAYGHLNLALLDRNPTIQHMMQLTMLAPDFLEARGKFVGQAAKSFINSKSGAEQLRAIGILAGVQAGLALIAAQLSGGEWDPKHPFEMTRNGRSYTMRSVPEDLFRLFFSGPDVSREFISARLSPVVSKSVQGITGRNYRGEKTTLGATAWEFLTNYIPIMARWMPGIKQLTETSRNSPISPFEQLLGSSGLKVSRYSPITKTYQLATQWKQANGIPRDVGTYPVSKFQQMRYALEDNDTEKAAEEFKKLVGAVPDAEARDQQAKRRKVVLGFKESMGHPFTESKEMDAKFKRSLGPAERAMFDAAVKRRIEINRRFEAMKVHAIGVW